MSPQKPSSLSALKPTPPLPSELPYVKHPRHYYPDGNFAFIVQGSLFRVYKGLLARRSEVFETLFDIPQDKHDKPHTSGRHEAEDRLIVEGVPAVVLDDDPGHFANLLDIIAPPIIVEDLDPTVDDLIGIFLIADKYAIEDIRSWALSWLDDALPIVEDDITTISQVYGDIAVAARVIQFAITADLPQYLPLAYYALATHQWEHDREGYQTVVATLSMHQQYLITSGRARLEVEILTHMFTLPEFGIADRMPCMLQVSSGQICHKSRQKSWTDPKELAGELIKSPLETLDARVKHPVKHWCSKCTIDSVSKASFARNTLFRKLREIFEL